MAGVPSRVAPVPAVLHSLEELEEFWREREIQRSVVWVAEVEGIVAFLARERREVHHLSSFPSFRTKARAASSS